MTNLEFAAATALSKLKLYPDSSEDKFVKAMANRGKFGGDGNLSWGQRQFLWKLVLRHRKKITDSALIKEAESEIFKHYQESLF